ncbi:MAG TPA: hypothetical protein VFD56_03825, partial [Chitinophagaceae bacterium]|nr:hypothetical protein [Chitinophagaceae bacterium]
AYPAGGWCGLAPGEHCVRAKSAEGVGAKSAEGLRATSGDGCISDQTCITIPSQPTKPAAPTLDKVDPTCTVATGCVTVTSSTTGLTFSIDGGGFAAYPAGGWCGLAPGEHCVRAKSGPYCVSYATCITIPAQPVCVTFEGCTPGYWKNHPEAWGCGYNTYTNFFDVFSVVTNRRGLSLNLKLGQAVAPGGGQFNALARHAVAALLNACHNNVDYPYTQEQIIAAVVQMFNTNGTVTLGSNTYRGWEALKNELDRANNLGCPLNNSNSVPITGNRSKNVTAENFTELKVEAYPNPYTDVVKFTIESDVSGRAQLVVVNMLGQTVGIAYNGLIQANKAQVVQYRVPTNVQENLIYVLRIGGKQITGKLLRLHK